MDAATGATTAAAPTGSSGQASAQRQQSNATAPDYDVRLLPLGAGYPALYPLREILTAWNLDVTSIPAHYGRFSSLRWFNGSDVADMAEAEAYRVAELPFVVRAPPGVAPAVARWRSDKYMRKMARGVGQFTEVNDNKVRHADA